ncbi:MAG TPA: PQQ-binding-like beta-propeller repeat protein, partial [Planctomycetota bacterium]
GDLVPVFRPRWSRRPIERPLERATADPARATDFPRFLGPSGDGRLPGPALATDWTARAPVPLWRRAVGSGWSGFAVAGGRAVTQEQHGEDERVVAYDLASGAPLWSHSDPARYDTTLGGAGPRATPSIDGGRVYALGATGLLTCLELSTGARVWSVDLVRDAGVPVPPWGFAGSPVLEGRLVLAQAGPLLAYDRATGKRVWSSGAEAASYASPLIATLGGRRQAVALSQSSCAGYDPVSGDLLWRYAWRGDQPKCAPPAAVGGDRLVISAGYGVGADLLRIADGTVDLLWTSKKLKSKFANFVERQGFLYGLDDGRLGCVRVDTGERAWAGERYGHGQILLAGDLLLVTAESGAVALVDASPDAFRERARFQALEGKMWNPPALAGPYLLVRTDRDAACVELPLR